MEPITSLLVAVSFALLFGFYEPYLPAPVLYVTQAALLCVFIATSTYANVCSGGSLAGRVCRGRQIGQIAPRRKESFRSAKRWGKMKDFNPPILAHCVWPHECVLTSVVVKGFFEGKSKP